MNDVADVNARILARDLARASTAPRSEARRLTARPKDQPARGTPPSSYQKIASTEVCYDRNRRPVSERCEPPRRAHKSPWHLALLDHFARVSVQHDPNLCSKREGIGQNFPPATCTKPATAKDCSCRILPGPAMLTSQILGAIDRFFLANHRSSRQGLSTTYTENRAPPTNILPIHIPSVASCVIVRVSGNWLYGRPIYTARRPKAAEKVDHVADCHSHQDP